MLRTSTIRKILTAVWLGLAAHSAQAQDMTSLELKAYVDEAGWSLITNGEYAKAATEIQNQLRSSDPQATLAAYNNLCVANTMLREFEAAASACDTAVRRAKLFDRRFGRRDRTATSTALGNRGVLNILLQNKEDAISDLIKATALSRDVSTAPERNLAYARSLTQQSFADAD